MNNLEKDRSKDNPSKSNTPCPFILRRGWCIKGERTVVIFLIRI